MLSFRPPKALVVSLHDAHPGSLRQVGEQRRLLEEWGIHKASILVVPEYHHQKPTAQDNDFCEWASAWEECGDELVVHGFYHDRVGQRTTFGNFFWTRFYTNQEAEFLDLGTEEARTRLQGGKALFAEKNWKARGFIAPAWLMAERLEPLLWEEGFAYTNYVHGLQIQCCGYAGAQSLCWSTRAKWRRVASRFYNARLFRKILGERLVRISLHPQDFEFPAIRKQIQGMIKTALQHGYVATTYADYVSAR
jgi:predicted deacetylase